MKRLPERHGRATVWISGGLFEGEGYLKKGGLPLGTPPLLLSLEAYLHIFERKECERQDDGQGNDIDGCGKRGNEGATDCAGYVAASLGDRAADGNGYRCFKTVVVFHTARAGVALAAHPDCARSEEAHV